MKCQKFKYHLQLTVVGWLGQSLVGVAVTSRDFVVFVVASIGTVVTSSKMINLKKGRNGKIIELLLNDWAKYADWDSILHQTPQAFVSKRCP